MATGASSGGPPRVGGGGLWMVMPRGVSEEPQLGSYISSLVMEAING